MRAIVCMDDRGGIGYKNKLPWRCKLDIQYFRNMTIGNGNNAIVMGRKTFDSMNNRALQKRRNYVMTRDATLSSIFSEDIIMESQLENILLLPFIFEQVYVIGGSQIYKLFEPHLETIYVTHLAGRFHCDEFFPIDLNKYTKEVINETFDEVGRKVTFCVYHKGNPGSP